MATIKIWSLSAVWALGALGSIVGGGAVAADKNKPVAKATPTPAPKNNVKGMTQMAGGEGKLGVTYTIGQPAPLNVTLTGAQFRVERVNIGEESFAPKADEKLLVLTGEVHNPNNHEFAFNWASLKFTVVDGTNVNREYVNKIGRTGTGEDLYIDLKPAQKVGFFTVIIVPAKGVVPKLIVQPETGGGVLRYDLRQEVKALPAPFAAPEDPSGATARAEVPAEAGKFYPLLGWDMKLVNTAYVAGPLGEHEAGEGRRFVVATVTIKNAMPFKAAYDGSIFAPLLLTSDGEKVEYNSVLLKNARNEYANGEMKPNEEYTARFIFAVPQDVTAKKLLLAQPESRAYAFDVSATQ